MAANSRRGPKQNNNKNHQAHEEWVRRKKLGTLDPVRLSSTRLSVDKLETLHRGITVQESK